MTGQIPPLPPGYRLEQPQGSIPPLPPGYSLETNSVTSRPGVPRPSAPQLSPSEEMPLSQAEEDAQGNTGQTLRELGAPATIGLGLGLAAPTIASGAVAVGPGVARALLPIAQRYGIKALEGAGLGLGWHLYKELKNVFEGSQ